MQIAVQLMVLAHLVGFAALLGGCLAQAGTSAPEVNVAMLSGAWLATVTGVLLVVSAQVGHSGVNWAQVGVKTVIAGVALLLVAKNRKFADIPRGLLGLIGGLALANAAVAVFWT